MDQREETDGRQRRRIRSDRPDLDGGKYWKGRDGAHFKAIQKLRFDQNQNGNGQEQTILSHHAISQFQHQQIFAGPHVPGGFVSLPPPNQLKPAPTQQNLPHQKLHHVFVSQSPIPSSYLPYLPHQPLFKANHVPKRSMYGQQGHHEAWCQPQANCDSEERARRAEKRSFPRQNQLPYPPTYHAVSPDNNPRPPAQSEPDDGHAAQAEQCAQLDPDSQYS